MSTKTGIAWTDATWNAVVGCERITPGCAHCYARTLHIRRHKAYHEGKRVPEQYAVPFETVQLMPERLLLPLAWRKPRRIFVNSMSDLFHDDVPDQFIDSVLAIAALCKATGRDHVFQILTKRASRLQKYFTSIATDEDGFGVQDAWADRLAGAAMPLGEDADCAVGNSINGVLAEERNVGWPLNNVWLGVSVENQRWANERIPFLLDTPAAVRFLSCEPLLGNVDLTDVGRWRHERLSALEEIVGFVERPRVDWVIAGGESGPGCREMREDWARELRDQCRDAGVPFFLKQLGGHPNARAHEQAVLDGRTWTEMPELRL